MNQARASKMNDSGYSAYQLVFGRNPQQMKMLFWSAEEQIWGVVSSQQTGELAHERSMTVRRLALQASSALDHKRRWKRALHHAAKHYKGEMHVGQPSGFGDVEAMQPRNQQMLLGTRAWSSATRWPQFGLPTTVPQSNVHDSRCDRFTTMTRRHTNTSRNT